MTYKRPHKHAAFITEWVKDTSRKVEMCVYGDVWQPKAHPHWDENVLYRFAPDEPKKEIGSSLTDEELIYLFNPYSSDYRAAARRIANKAAERAIEDLKIPEDSFIYELSNKFNNKTILTHSTVRSILSIYLDYIKSELE